MRQSVSFHPAVRILIWTCFVVLAFSCSPRGLAAITLLLLPPLGFHTRGFFRLARRSRWILASLIAIYAFDTPGEALFPQISWASPTYDGLDAGLIQLWRILLTVGALAVLLGSTSREALLSGIYDLSAPLRLFGVSRERIAVRLWLTLHYAEGEKTAGRWQERLRAALEPAGAETQTLKLELYRLRFFDHAALCCIFCTGAWLL